MPLAQAPNDMALDALDKGRDETIFFDGLDDFVENLESKSAVKIKTLEKTLENEKRRLANMELALVEAKKQKQSELKVTVVSKQSNMLSGMMEVLKTMTSKEMEAKQDWDIQWREKFSDLHQQHLDMEAALRQKQVEELKSLQGEIREEVKAFAIQAKESQGRSMPSPRTMQRIQDNNMQRVVALFHKHAQERLYLASKITQQEELLIRAKNRSLQQKISQVQTKSNRFCEKLQNFGEQQLKKIQIELVGDFISNTTQSSANAKKAIRNISLTNGQLSRSFDHQHEANGSNISLNASSDSIGRSDSPRVGGSTFVTEIDHDLEPAVRRPKDIRSHASWTHKSESSLAVESAMSDPTCAQDVHQKLETRFSPTNAIANIRRSQPSPERLATNFPQHAKQSVFGNSAIDPENPTNTFAGQEFAGWAPPTSSILKNERKPKWNNYPCKWNPNIIALESSVAVSSRHAASPYATFAVGERQAERRNPSKAGNGSSRMSKKVKHSHKDNSRSASARLPHTHQNHYHVDNRSQSTEPRIEHIKNRKPAPDFGRGRTTLPQIIDRNNRQHSTDPNFNRPKTDNLDEVPTATEKFSKLESWIEDKIRDVLGSNSTKSAILSNLLASQMQHKGDSEAQEDEQYATARQPSDEFLSTSLDGRDADFRGLASTIPMRDVDSRGVRDMDSRGHVRSVQSIPRGHPGSEWLLRSGIEQLSQQATANGAAGNSLGRPAADNSVGGFMSRLRSGMSEGESDLEASNQGLRVESRASGRPAGAITAASIMAPKPEAAPNRREVRQSGDDMTGDGAAEAEEAPDVKDRRERFDRAVAAGARAGKSAPAAAAGGPKAAKRVGWNLSPRDSEVDNASEDPAQQQLGTSSAHGLSRPGTSRPSTSASSVIGDDDADDAPANNRRDADDEEGGKGWSEAEIRDLFSKVRHNKVAEVEELLQGGFPTDVRDRHGNTPLLVAAQNGHKRLVKMLLREGADINATNHQGNTALHFTTSYGYQSLANYLVSKGADDTLMNMRGLTCYDGLG